MQFEEKLDVIEENIAKYSRELLDILLKDRTTNANIIWATNDYICNGELYAATEQIYSNLITGIHSNLIQPRVAKEHKQKNSRTRDKAEVFTPSWICNAQNNLVDEHWFGRPDVFNIQQENIWTATKFLSATVKPCQFSIRSSNKLRNFTIQKLARKSLLDLELM